MSGEGPKTPKLEGGIENGLNPKVRLSSILAAQLTPDNIDTYFDEALEKLVHLSEGVVDEYTKDNDVSGLSKRDIEDAAFEHFGVQSIPEILTAISARKQDIEAVDTAIQQKTRRVGNIIVPTIPEKPQTRTKAKHRAFEFRKKEIKGRVKTLLYILIEEGANLDEVDMVRGEVKRNMIRQESYVSVAIPSLNRLVLICDEENNASFVFDTEGLERVSMPVEELPMMNKPELNEFIARHPDVAARIIFSRQWVADVRKILNTPISEAMNVAPQEELLKVATSELDPWRGFYTDPDGKHYAPLRQILTRLGLSYAITKVDTSTLESRYVQALGGAPAQAYAFEDFEAVYGYALSLPESITEKGEWEGFYEQDGKHYGAFNALFRKFKSVSIKTLEERAKELRLVPIQVRDRFNKPRDAYAYEDLEPVIAAMTEVPVVNTEGEWKGFLERDGEHFAPVWILAERIDLSHHSMKSTIDDYRKTHPLKEISVRNASGRVLEAFSFEEIMQIPKIKAYVESPQVNTSGEWKDFLEKDGKHWGTEWALAARLGVDKTTIKKRTDRNPELPKIQVRTKAGTVKQAWAFEDIEPLVKK